MDQRQHSFGNTDLASMKELGNTKDSLQLLSIFTNKVSPVISN